MKKIRKGTVSYFALINSQSTPGVARKIQQTLLTMKKDGYKTNEIMLPSRGIYGHLRLLKKIMCDHSSIVFIRATGPLMFLLLLGITYRRLKGARITIDVPTPVHTTNFEIWGSNHFLIGNLGRIIANYISYPLVFFPATKVIQYAEEHWWFKIGANSKSQLMCNGISVESIPRREKIPLWPADELVLIGVATLAPWHGYDRVIKGISNYVKEVAAENRVKIKFIIVGEGEVRSQWEALATALKIKDSIEFAGPKKGAELDHLFDTAHIAVCSLALFRKKMKLSSELKAREYTSRGLPFILSGRDLDFEPTPYFVTRLEDANHPVNIQKLIKWYNELSWSMSDVNNIRDYAHECLDYSVKLESMMPSSS